MRRVHKAAYIYVSDGPRRGFAVAGLAEGPAGPCVGIWWPDGMATVPGKPGHPESWRSFSPGAADEEVPAEVRAILDPILTDLCRREDEGLPDRRVGRPRTTGRGSAREWRLRPSDEERTTWERKRLPGESDADLIRRALTSLG